MISNTESQAIALLQPLVRVPFYECCLSRYSIGESFYSSDVRSVCYVTDKWWVFILWIPDTPLLFLRSCGRLF